MYKSHKQTEASKEKIRKTMKGKHKGKANPAWKGGMSRGWGNRIKKESSVCGKCGSNENLEVHHLDKNPQNNELSNLQILCRYCHKIEHIEHLIPFQYKKGENIHPKGCKSK